MSDIIQIFDNEESDNSTAQSATQFTMDSVRSMVKQMNEIEDKVKDLREEKKELFDDFVEHYNVPKKEVMIAIRMLKGDIDPDTTVDIYANIADLVD